MYAAKQPSLFPESYHHLHPTVLSPGRYHVKASRYVSTSTTDDLAAMVDGRKTTLIDELDIEITTTDDAVLETQFAPYVEQLKSPNEEMVQEAAVVAWR